MLSALYDCVFGDVQVAKIVGRGTWRACEARANRVLSIYQQVLFFCYVVYYVGFDWVGIWMNGRSPRH